MSPVKSPPEPNAQDTSKKDEIAVEKTDTDELPPGWTIEVRTRKRQSGSKYDRYYTDPVTGYIFRSLRDAHRYLKTGVIGRLAMKPKNNDAIESKEKVVAVHSPVSETPSRKRPLANGSESEGSKTRSKSSEMGKSELPQRASKRLAGKTIDTPSPGVKTPLAAPPEAKTQLEAPPPTPPEPKTRHAKRKAGTEVDTPPLTAPLEPKTRKATRLAGIAVNSPPSPPEPKTSSQIIAKQAKEAEKIDRNADIDNKPNLKQESSILVPPRKADVKQDSQKVLPPATPAAPPPATHTIPEHKPPPSTLPPVNSAIQTTNKHLGKQESPVNNPPVQENPINYSMNNFWTDPCIEFAVKTLTGAIPFGDLNKADNFSSSPPLETPMEDIWTDPCIEFAVKTLTGAIPVEDTSVQGYLQHHKPSASLNTSHGFSLNVCQSEVLSTGLNKKQQDSGKIAVHHQQVSGSSGQCSRPRFFQ